MRLLLVAALACLGPLTTITAARAEQPHAARPTYALGQRWVRDDGLYVFRRAEDDHYVFAADDGREIRLSQDLAIVRISRGTQIDFEIDPPPAFAWPLTVGRWGVHEVALRSATSGGRRRVKLIWEVAAYEDVVVAKRVVKAFRIVQSMEWPRGPGSFGARGSIPGWDWTAMDRGTVTLWYAPEVQQIVKAESAEFSAWRFKVVEIAPSAAPLPSTADASEPQPMDVGALARPGEPVRLRLTGPPRAKVRIDHKDYVLDRRGRVEIRLAPGTHVAEVEAAGYRPHTAPIVVPVDRAWMRTDLALEPLPAPTVTVLEPTETSRPASGNEGVLKVKVDSQNRVKVLRIVRDGRRVESLRPPATYQSGEPWVVETLIRGLDEGDNRVTVEAEDEFGRKGTLTANVVRESAGGTSRRSSPSRARRRADERCRGSAARSRAARLRGS